MAKLQRRPFGDADDVRPVPKGRLETYDMGDLRIGRSILEPGWRWSESVKPIAGTEWCEFHHIGLCVAGKCRITMREGAEIVIGAGQFYEVPPGHDAEVIGVPYAHLALYEERLPNATSRPIDGPEHSFINGLPALVRDIRQVVVDGNA